MRKNIRKKDVVRMLHLFQEEYDVAQIKVNGISFWPLILSELKFYTNKSNQVEKRVNIGKFIRKELFALVRMAVRMREDRKKSRDISKSADVLFLTQPTRREKLDGEYFDRITDPFYDALTENGYKCQVLEWSFDNNIKTPRYNPSKYIQFQIYIAFVKNLLRAKPTFELDLLDTSEFKEILSVFEIKPHQFIKVIKRNAGLVINISRMFQKRLRHTKAKTAFFFPHYGIISFAFNLACKEMGIKTVEIQHAYIGKNKITENGYNDITQKYKLLPNAVWCWEERDKNTILGWSSDKTKLPIPFVGGNLWTNLWKFPGLNNNPFVRARNISTNVKQERLKAVFTLSPNYNIPEWLPEIINTNIQSIDWLIRFHPHTEANVVSQYMKAFNKVSKENFKFANTKILPLLLSVSDIHITVNSSAVAEAKEFGLKSVIVSDEGAVIFKEFITEGWAVNLNAADDFSLIVKQIISGFYKKKSGDSNLNPKSNGTLLKLFLKIVHDK